MAQQEESHHILPQGTYWKTWGMLMVLMVLTILVARAPYHVAGLAWVKEHSLFNNLIALGIAFWKAVLVVQIFMGVRYAPKLIKVFAYGGFLWLAMLSIIFLDYWSRSIEPVEGWEPLAPGALPRESREHHPTSPYGNP